MLSLYDGPLDIPTWSLTLPGGTYAFRPTVTRAGGPVLFTSVRAVERFLAWHALAWGPLTDARPTALPLSLRAAVARWRALYGGPAEAPVAYGLLFLDPHEPCDLIGDVDADVIPFDPGTFPRAA